MAAPAAPPATREERERLRADFIRLCEIESPSGRERGVADAVTDELRALGIEVDEDGSAGETGSDAGNLLARVPGASGEPTVLLCAHLDTVPLAAPVEVICEDGILRNRNEGILGADNKSAVAVLLAVARRAVAELPAIGLELLFTTCEERALAGAKAFDAGRLTAGHGFVFDHASPVGELIVAAPSYYRIEGRFRGQAAHAGVRPEQGRNAIAAAAAAIARLELGRLDQDTTANVGRIEGGSAVNVVAERCRVELEARSLDRTRAADVAADIVDALTAAGSDAGCDVETLVEEQFRGYRLARSSPPVAAAERALAGLGLEPLPRATGGGSDANVLNARGIPCLNVADGTERNHEPGEQITIDSLEATLDIALGVVAASA